MIVAVHLKELRKQLQAATPAARAQPEAARVQTAARASGFPRRKPAVPHQQSRSASRVHLEQVLVPVCGRVVGECPEPGEHQPRQLPPASPRPGHEAKPWRAAGRLRSGLPSANAPAPADEQPSDQIARQPETADAPAARDRSIRRGSAPTFTSGICDPSGPATVIVADVLSQREREKHLLPRRDRAVHRLSQRQQQSGVDQRIVDGQPPGVEAVGRAGGERCRCCSRIRPPSARSSASRIRVEQLSR